MDIKKVLEIAEQMDSEITVEQLYWKYKIEEKLVKEGEPEWLAYKELEKRLPEWEEKFNSKQIKIKDLLKEI